MDADLELFQFRYSHYNEKVRWALDSKVCRIGAPTCCPDHHARMLKKLTGQTQTPVLRMNSEYVHDSAWIIERLELISRMRRRFIHAMNRYATGAGTCAPFRFCCRSRGARVWSLAMLDSATHRAYVFDRQPLFDRTLYRVAFPFVKSLLKQANGITDRHAIAEADRLVAANMESIAKITFKSKYLAGNQFSIADLTAARHLLAR